MSELKSSAKPSLPTGKLTSFFQAVGRGREAPARVRLFKGQGQLTVNGRPIAEYFTGLVAQKLFQKPFELTKTTGEVSGSVKVVGGGFNSQLEATIHGIARALQILDKDKHRGILKSNGLLTRDPRAREKTISKKVIWVGFLNIDIKNCKGLLKKVVSLSRID